MSTRSRLAVFDVDGTLVRGDAYLHYLVYVWLRRPSRWPRGPALGWGVLLFATGIRGNTWLKEWFLRHVLSGLESAREARLTQAFLHDVVQCRLKGKGLATLRHHLAHGNRVVLLSAGMDIYLRSWGDALGVDDILCSVAERGVNGRITGRLVGANCRGAEKVRRLDEYLADFGDRGESPHITVYSDHHSDLPLLQRADVAVAVDPTPRLRALCRLHGFGIERWLDNDGGSSAESQSGRR